VDSKSPGGGSDKEEEEEEERNEAQRNRMALIMEEDCGIRSGA
jgi:hypothetical protein